MQKHGKKHFFCHAKISNATFGSTVPGEIRVLEGLKKVNKKNISVLDIQRGKSNLWRKKNH